MSNLTEPFIIAIDGPAASGKGTLARKIAAYYHLPHLDTGLSYRAVADVLLKAGSPLDDDDLAVQTAQQLDFSQFDASHLSSHKIGKAASKVAVLPKLRQALVLRQRAFAKTYPGAVLDGRDIGTVVCPDANVKLYIVADAATRAKRRYDEIIAKGQNAEYEVILQDVINRDKRDMTREESPLKAADDAYLLDTTNLGIETAFETARARIDPIWKKYTL